VSALKLNKVFRCCGCDLNDVVSHKEESKETSAQPVFESQLNKDIRNLEKKLDDLKIQIDNGKHLNRRRESQIEELRRELNPPDNFALTYWLRFYEDLIKRHPQGWNFFEQSLYESKTHCKNKVKEYQNKINAIQNKIRDKKKEVEDYENLKLEKEREEVSLDLKKKKSRTHSILGAS
jgi:predicted RNase H-like nuclease (RuvC/YqgF family)